MALASVSTARSAKFPLLSVRSSTNGFTPGTSWTLETPTGAVLGVVLLL